MSVEAMVLLPWYEQLFTDDERTKARRRLDHQFDIDSFVQRRRVSPPPWTAEEQ